MSEDDKDTLYAIYEAVEMIASEHGTDFFTRYYYKDIEWAGDDTMLRDFTRIVHGFCPKSIRLKWKGEYTTGT